MATRVLTLHENTCFDRPNLRLRRHDYLPRSESVRDPAPVPALKDLPASGGVLTEAERDRKVLALLPLVRRMALKMRRHLPVHVEVDDLVGAGMLGLLDAAQKFDAQKRVKIEVYARHRIRGAILDGLRTLDTASRDMRKKNKKVEKAVRDLQFKLGRPAEDEEMARALGVSLKKWHRAVQELQSTGIDWLRPMQLIESKQLSVESLVAENQENQFNLCYRREQRDILNSALACLSERERTIMILYHAREMTMKQIGARLKIDESRVSQLHSAALGRLRSSVRTFLESPNPSLSPSHGGASESLN